MGGVDIPPTATHCRGVVGRLVDGCWTVVGQSGWSLVDNWIMRKPNFFLLFGSIVGSSDLNLQRLVCGRGGGWAPGSNIYAKVPLAWSVISTERRQKQCYRWSIFVVRTVILLRWCWGGEREGAWVAGLGGSFFCRFLVFFCCSSYVIVVLSCVCM